LKSSLYNVFLLLALIAGLGLTLAGRVTPQTFTTLRSFDEAFPASHGIADPPNSTISAI
jgi:hypothetical protein